MKKRLFLLPILALSLALAGCSFGDEGDGGNNNNNNNQPAAKEIWEEDLVEGESTFAQVKEGAAGQYYKVRGTVAGNAGSTFSLYRNGEYLYCYNFNPDQTLNGGAEKLEEHPVGAYVEVYAQSSEYAGTKQLTAYDVGTNKTGKKYDGDAIVHKLADRGETVVPKVGAAEADFANVPATAALMKVDFVPKKDFTFTKSATANQDILGRVGEYEITLRCDTYLTADAKQALFGDEGLKLGVGNTYEVVAMAIATSSNYVRLLLVDSSTITLKSAPVWTDPTSVEIEADGDITELEVGETLQLYFKVLPNTAKPSVEWSSEDESVMTVNEDGLVRAKAVGTKKIYATASKGDVSVRGEYQIEVKPSSVVITKVTSPVANTKYKMAIYVSGETAYYYGTGVIKSNYGATSTNLEDAVDYEFIEVTGGYNIKVTLGNDSVKYMNAIVKNNTYFNLAYENTASTVWTFNAAAATLYVECSGFTGDSASKNGTYFVGTNGTYRTVGPRKASNIEGDTNAAKIDVSEFPVHFYTVA